MNDAVDYIPCNYPKPKAISHGSPYNRGRADSWYEKDINPHYYPNGTYREPRIDLKDMTKDQIDAYIKGYNDIKAEGSKPMTFIELHNEGLF